ncbi:hypothetical protein [Arsenicibacter rosenii]|uniref:Uncharacterized protein n=1 Tax=Arsenicibacter rosenii TaxID=1750698 RepID=A0A1S2VBV3_9BACT|nr:hypothetical protein [Arsenicibacter rosenii]OIN56221.1 hypothetical protein BLX24_25830 [Arsenicibacter rosenii]
MRRAVVISIWLASASFICYGQRDTARPAPAPANPPIMTPGIDSPISAPGTMLQSSTRTQPERPVRRKRKGKRGIRIEPLSDPRGFGVAIPIGTAKKDSLRKEKP